MLLNFLKVEQDHRAIKRITKGMLRLKSFNSASITVSGIEIVRMIRKGQIETEDKSVHSSKHIVLFGCIVRLM
ncbi:transposase [bacterium]|nr:transposase [bacterium]